MPASRSPYINFALYEGGDKLIERKRPCIRAEDIRKELKLLGEAQIMRYAWYRDKRIRELKGRLGRCEAKKRLDKLNNK